MRYSDDMSREIFPEKRLAPSTRGRRMCQWEARRWEFRNIYATFVSFNPWGIQHTWDSRSRDEILVARRELKQVKRYEGCEITRATRRRGERPRSFLRFLFGESEIRSNENLTDLISEILHRWKRHVRRIADIMSSSAACMRCNLYHDIAIYCSKIHDMRQKKEKNLAARVPFFEAQHGEIWLPPVSAKTFVG